MALHLDPSDNDVAPRLDGRGYALDAPAAVRGHCAPDLTDDDDDADGAVECPAMLSPPIRPGETGSEVPPAARQGGGALAWPLRGIREPGVNDCLTGRGGGTNHHPGNVRYRALVEKRKVAYRASSREEKSALSMRIVREWRTRDPPGRFLRINDRTGLWGDIGDEEARVKISQALREKRPSRLVPETSVRDVIPHLRSSAAQTVIDRVAALAEPIGGLPTTAGKDEAQMTSGHSSWHVICSGSQASAESTAKVVESRQNSPAHLVSSVQASHRKSDESGQNSPSVLLQCLAAVGIDDRSLLSGTADDELRALRRSYLQTVLAIHPRALNNWDGGDRSHCLASLRDARAAFGALTSLSRSVRARCSSLAALVAPGGEDDVARDLYVGNLYEHFGRLQQGIPPYEHYEMAAAREGPSAVVGLSPDGLRRCTVCDNTIPFGGIVVETTCGLHHVRCWSPSPEVRSGMTDPSDSVIAVGDVAAMDEIAIGGFGTLGCSCQLEFVKHLVKWRCPSPRETPSEGTDLGGGTPGLGSRPGDFATTSVSDDWGCQNENRDHKRGPDRGDEDSPSIEELAIARPLKKRVVAPKTLSAELS